MYCPCCDCDCVDITSFRELKDHLMLRGSDGHNLRPLFLTFVARITSHEMLTSATASILSAGAGATNILPAASTSSAGQNQSKGRDRGNYHLPTDVFRRHILTLVTLLETLSEKETSLVQKLKPMTGANVLYLKEYAKNPPPRKAQVYGVTAEFLKLETALMAKGLLAKSPSQKAPESGLSGKTLKQVSFTQKVQEKSKAVTVTKQAPVITRKRLISPEPDTADEQDDDEDKNDSPKKKTDGGGNSADIEADSGGENDSESAENASLSELAKIYSQLPSCIKRRGADGRGDDGRGDDGHSDDGSGDDGSGDDGHAVTNIYRDSDSETNATNSKKRKTASKGGKAKQIKNQKGEAKKNEPKQSPTKPVAKDSSSKAKRPNEIGVNDPIEVLHHYAKMVAIPHYSKMSRPELWAELCSAFNQGKTHGKLPRPQGKKYA
ncbi:hypothetical protein BC829DRAFT_414269 [Chytridium lagenaria]|nr:hypothetical protein BC829DRAFT_414269 [Chytridium lagenaria]